MDQAALGNGMGYAAEPDENSRDAGQLRKVWIALIRNPFGGVNAVGIVIGLWLVLAGAIGVARAITERRHRILRALLSCAEIAVGIIIVSEPRIGYTALAVIAGIWLIVSGISAIAFSISVHRATE